MASDFNILKNKAIELFKNKQYAEIISLLSDEILNKHEDTLLYYFRGVSWDDKHNYEIAISDYSNAIYLDPRNVNAYYKRGISWKNKGDYDKAISDYNKTIELKPNHADSYFNRGNAWHNKGENDFAIADYNKTIELRPDYVSAYYNRGSLLRNKGENDKAIADYSRAIELNPDDAFCYNNRGISWNNRGDIDKAIIDYSKAIELKPDYAPAYYNRGISRKIKGDINKAIIDFSKAIKLKPDYAYYYYHRGLAWKIKSKFEKAVEDFSKYIELTLFKSDIWTERAKSIIKELLILQGDEKLKEIDDIIKFIKKLLVFNSGCVTHYTSLTAAKLLLLEESSFRISEGAFLNDTSEGRELFKFLDLKITSEKRTDDTVAEPFAQKPFIGSFVEETKFDDLNLWRMYGKENNVEAKGCALTINADKFVEGINKVLDSSGDKSMDSGKMTAESDDINFYRVAYRLNDKLDEFFVPGLKLADVRKLNKLLKELVAKVKVYDQTPENKKDLEEAINNIAFLFKSDVYRSENELRLVVKGVGFKKKFDKDAISPKVYIDLVNIRPMVEKITLGPKVERPDEWAAAFYYSYDKEEKPKILISHLPFK